MLLLQLSELERKFSSPTIISTSVHPEIGAGQNGGAKDVWKEAEKKRWHQNVSYWPLSMACLNRSTIRMVSATSEILECAWRPPPFV